eukprot:403338853
MVNLISKELAEHAINGGFIHCRDIHDHSCAWQAFEKFWTVMKIASKFYLPIHCIPILIFKRKKILEQPLQVVKQAAVNVLRSCLFMSCYIAIFRYLTCLLKNTRGKIDRLNIVIAGFFCTFAILFEPSHRRTELALYLIPRFLEAFWAFLEKRGFVQSVQYGEVLIFAFAMGIIMYCYQNEEKSIKSTYLSMFKRFWGIN